MGVCKEGIGGVGVWKRGWRGGMKLGVYLFFIPLVITLIRWLSLKRGVPESSSVCVERVRGGGGV